MFKPIKELVIKEMHSTREGYGQALLELGKNKKVVALSADLTESTYVSGFAKKYPERFFQCGVAEQNMVSMAAGLALEGKIPFASSFGVFVPIRCLDQIRISVCYQKANVKLVGSHCGLATGEDGATHQALEDVGALRAMPGLTIIEPSDYEQAIKATKEVGRWKGAVYLRLHRAKFPALSGHLTTFKIGKAQILQKGGGVTIIGAGPILNEAFKAGQHLEFKPEIINCHTIKPLDKKTILSSAKKTGKVLVIQDHQVYGGLGSAIAELLSEEGIGKVRVLGVRESFGESGLVQELWRKHGMDYRGILEEIRKF